MQGTRLGLRIVLVVALTTGFVLVTALLPPGELRKDLRIAGGFLLAWVVVFGPLTRLLKQQDARWGRTVDRPAAVPAAERVLPARPLEPYRLPSWPAAVAVAALLVPVPLVAAGGWALGSLLSAAPLLWALAALYFGGYVDRDDLRRIVAHAAARGLRPVGVETVPPVPSLLLEKVHDRSGLRVVGAYTGEAGGPLLTAVLRLDSPYVPRKHPQTGFALAVYVRLPRPVPHVVVEDRRGRAAPRIDWDRSAFGLTTVRVDGAWFDATFQTSTGQPQLPPALLTPAVRAYLAGSPVQRDVEAGGDLLVVVARLGHGAFVSATFDEVVGHALAVRDAFRAPVAAV